MSEVDPTPPPDDVSTPGLGRSPGRSPARPGEPEVAPDPVGAAGTPAEPDPRAKPATDVQPQVGPQAIPDGPGPRAPDTPAAPREPITAGGLLGLVLLVVLGLGVRWAYIEHLGQRVGEWEADGMIVALEGRLDQALNRLRPAGSLLVWSRLCEAAGVESVVRVRQLVALTSLVAWLAAAWLTLAVGAASRLAPRSRLRGLRWTTLVWAVHPTLVAASVSPTPELLSACGAALVLGAFAAFGARRTAVRWLGSAVAAAVFVTLGGVVAAVSLAAAVLVYLAPVPRASRALAALAALAVALAAGLWVQQEGDLERAWLPDTGVAHAMLDWAEVPPPDSSEQPAIPDEREAQVLAHLAEHWSDAGAPRLVRALGGRLVFELMGLSRFGVLDPDPPPPPDTIVPAPMTGARGDLPWWLGAFDLVLRGGLLLYALAVLGTLRPGEPSSWPRAAAVMGCLVFVLGSALGAQGPFALAGIDLVLLGVAAAGVAASDPARPGMRRVGFVLGGALLVSLTFSAGLRRAGPLGWVAGLGHRFHEGQRLVEAVTVSDELRTVETELLLGRLFMQPTTPFLRMPRHALAHGLAAVEQDPRSFPAQQLLVRAYVECGQFREAAQLAEGIHAASGGQDPVTRVLLEWVQEQERRRRAPPLR